MKKIFAIIAIMGMLLTACGIQPDSPAVSVDNSAPSAIASSTAEETPVSSNSALSETTEAASIAETKDWETYEEVPFLPLVTEIFDCYELSNNYQEENQVAYWYDLKWEEETTYEDPDYEEKAQAYFERSSAYYNLIKTELGSILEQQGYTRVTELAEIEDWGINLEQYEGSQEYYEECGSLEWLYTNGLETAVFIGEWYGEDWDGNKEVSMVQITFIEP